MERKAMKDSLKNNISRYGRGWPSYMIDNSYQLYRGGEIANERILISALSHITYCPGISLKPNEVCNPEDRHTSHASQSQTNIEIEQVYR